MAWRFLPSLLSILSMADLGGSGPSSNCPDQGVVADLAAAPTSHGPLRVAGGPVDSLGVTYEYTKEEDLGLYVFGGNYTVAFSWDN